MSSIDNKDAFSHLVGLIQHLNDNLHKWLTLHFSIQTALIVAVATLMEWAHKNNGVLQNNIILLFGVFGCLISTLIGIILYRNRSYLGKFIEKAIIIEGENPYIWEKTPIVKKPGLQCTITIAHILIAVVWIIFMIVFFKCSS